MSSQRGFVLPITLILLALTSIALVVMSHRADLMREQVLRAQAQSEATRAIDAAQAEALYLSSALHRRGSRLGEIELDGRPYISSSGAIVSYRDNGAMLGLHRISDVELARMLVALGVKDPRLVERLVDIALDYMDADDLERLNGAEQRAYQAAGLPPPRNGPLLHAEELRRAPEWRDLPPAFWSAWLTQVHIGTQRTVNRFTVTGPVLAAISGVEPSVAEALVRERLPGEMLRIESLPTAAASYLAAGRYISVPSNSLTILLCHPHVSWCRQLGVTSLGESLHSPWRIEYAMRVEQPKWPAEPPQPLPDQLPDKPPPPLYNPLEQRTL